MNRPALFNNSLSETKNKFELPIRLLMLLILLVATIWPIIQLQSVAPLSLDTSLDQFSAMRAVQHIEKIAMEPRPSGSVNHKQAQNYILQVLSEFGLQPELMQKPVISTRWGMPFDSANVENIIAKIPARISAQTPDKKTILLICHYDTVPNSPGAADNGSGVATLLETARALKFSEPLQNDILLLFTDAEEGGALGAKAFVENYSELKSIELAINFDARGNRGAAVLFETTKNNGALIREFAKVAPHPITSSAFYEVARLLGLSTDFRLLREAGISGYNFAFTEGIPYYHTPIDNIVNLDKGSLQQQGEYALSLSRHFGNLNLTQLKQNNAIFFNISGKYLFSYPQYLTLPLLGFVILVFLATLIIGYRNKVLEKRGILLAFCSYIGIVTATILFTWIIYLLITRLHPAFQAMRTTDSYNVFYFRVTYIATGITIFLTLLQIFTRRITPFNFAIAIASIWLILAVISSIWFPGISYIFIWPLLIFLCSIILFIVKTNLKTIGIFIALIVTALPTLILVAPIPYLIFVSLQLKGVNFAILFVGLTCGILYFHLQYILAVTRWYLMGLFSLVAMTTFIFAIKTADFSPSQPLPTSVAYFQDVSQQKAYWLTEDRRLNSYSSQFIRSERTKEAALDLFPDNSISVMRDEANYTNDLTGPVIKLLADNVENGRRRLQMLITSPRNAKWLYVFVTSSPTILRTEINNIEVKDKIVTEPVVDSCWGFRHINLPADGLQWTIEVDATDQRPIEIVAIDQTFSLPAITANKVLPNNMMYARSWIANSTMARTRYKW